MGDQKMEHSYDIEMAVQHGPLAAIFIKNFQFWITKNKCAGRNRRDGRTWTYCTLKELVGWYPYFTRRQIETILNNLVKKGIILKGNYNKSGYDRTNWYAFVNEPEFIKDYAKPTKTSISQNCEMEITEWGNGNHETVSPIPDTKSTIKTTISDDICKNDENLNNDALEVLDFLNARTLKHHKPVESTLKLLYPRLREYGKRNLFQMIALKSNQWSPLNDKTSLNMRQYLRPQTLFCASKCAAYVAELYEPEHAQ